MLQTLTPEERVGQLFLVTFQGDDGSPETPIGNLIKGYHIGGVILQAANDNFTNVDQPLQQVSALTRQLQQDRWDASQEEQTNPVGGERFTPAYIPLFVGLPQEGDGFPYDQILTGVTPLPNEMALGATWNPELAAQVGAVLGKELSALGFNLLIGPSLDVLESPHPEGSNDLGTRTFGGDPFWVGEMGRAYIRGVHTGSQGQVAVVADHFPGHGGSDRLPEEEVATVRKNLEQLKSFELAPFFAVTGGAPSTESAADGLLVSHIRYQGFQGNIRATTRPVSFDPQAFNLLMSLPMIDAWRKTGGVMISDNLGSRAVRRFYDLTSQTFDARRVTLNAFLAGNDMLYVGDFSSTTDPDSYTAAIRTFEFFAQKYREDTAFAQRVDASVLRILTLKFRLYGEFSLDRVSAPAGNLAQEIGQDGQVTFDVARQAATLISPTQAELDDAIPDPPNTIDRIVIITDARTGQQCSKCPKEPLISVTAFQDVVLRRYGPLAGGQVSPNNISSYSLSDLQDMLDAPADQETPSQLEQDLSRANWIVLSMLDGSSSLPSYQTLSRFLSERPDLFQQKRLIVFAFNAPYYLDATNISKLTAYYALYSKTPQFVDVAAYLLFRELRSRGSLPVSVQGVSYDLITSLSPDPDQTIPLELDTNQPTPAITNTTPSPAPIMEFRVGDVIPVRTGIIQDHNGNRVPDGTPVDFILSKGGETATRQTATTLKGVARTTFPVSSPGTLEIRAESEPARSEILKFDIPSPSGEAEEPTPTATPTQTPTATPTPTVTPLPGATPAPPPAPPQPAIADWLMALFVSAVVAWSAYRLAAMGGQVLWGVRSGFLALIGGLLAYLYLALKLPGSEDLLSRSVSRGVILVTLAGAIIGLVATWSWRTVGGMNGKTGKMGKTGKPAKSEESSRSS